MNKRTPGHYPVLTTDTIRYGDTDAKAMSTMPCFPLLSKQAARKYSTANSRPFTLRARNL